MPAGITLAATQGILSGVPLVSGSSLVTLSATNAAGSGSAPLSILVAPVLQNQTAPTTAENQPLDYTIMTSDSVTAFTAAPLPPGLSFNSATGELTGAPTAFGAYSIPISIINAGGTSSATLSLFVPPGVTGTSTTFYGTDSENFSSLQLSNDPNATYQVSGLPPGLSLDTMNGEITGTAQQSGTFAVSVQVTDGARSITENFTVIIDALLTVDISGMGTVREELPGGGQINAAGSSSLPPGAPVTLEAVAAPGSYFAGWSGPVSPASATFAFILNNSAILTANFAPFSAARGSYSGLALGGGTNGLMEITLDAAAGFSGKAWLAGRAYPFHGRFGADGSFNGTIARGVPVELQLGTGRITGNLSMNGAAFALALAQSASPTSAQAGYYTLALPHSADLTLPQGDGFGSATVSPSGALRFAGTLGDGTPVTEGVSVSGSGVWPFFAAPYKAGGSISGSLQFDGTARNIALGGAASWFKTAAPNPRSTYPPGFAGSLSVIGAGYSKALPFPYTSGTAVIGAGGITAPGPVTLNINGIGRVTAGSAGFTLRFVPATGLFRGTFSATGVKKPIPFNGALLEDTARGYGEFLGAPLTGPGLSTGFIEIEAQ